MDISY